MLRVADGQIVSIIHFNLIPWNIEGVPHDLFHIHVQHFNLYNWKKNPQKLVKTDPYLMPNHIELRPRHWD